MRTILISAALLLMCGAAMAQDSRTWGGSSGTPDPTFERMGKDPSRYSESVTGTLVTRPAAGGTIAIQRADKSQLSFRIDQGARVRADKDTTLAGKKDLTINDYRPGDLVKVTYRIADNRVLELRLKRGSSPNRQEKPDPDFLSVN